MKFRQLHVVLCLALAGCTAPGGGTNAPKSAAVPIPTTAAAAADQSDSGSFGAKGRVEMAAVEKLVLHDAKRGKDLQLRVTYPRDGNRHPLIVWSHGAGGSKDNYQPLVTHWASHGYVVIQPTHSDSRSLGGRAGQRTRFQDWPSRPADVTFVLDSLDEVEKQIPALAGRIDRAAIGVGGHSFGANTAQLLGGATGSDTGNPRLKPNAGHLAWTQIVTLAYSEAYLRNDSAARAWLRSDGLATVSHGVVTVHYK